MARQQKDTETFRVFLYAKGERRTSTGAQVFAKRKPDEQKEM